MVLHCKTESSWKIPYFIFKPSLALLRLFSVDNRFNICNIVPCSDKSLDKSHLQDKVAAGDGGAEEAGQGEGEGDGEAQGSGRSVYL